MGRCVKEYLLLTRRSSADARLSLWHSALISRWSKANSCEKFATLNGRESQRLLAPTANLAGEPGPGWILPLETQ